MILPVLSSYHKILLYGEGSDGSATITDQSGKTWTARGNGQVDVAQRRFGGASILFDGTGDWVDTPDSGDFTIAGDITILAYVRYNSVADGESICGHSTDGNNGWRFLWSQSASSLFFQIFSAGSDVLALSGSWSPSTNTWYKITATRIGTAWELRVDNTLIASKTDLDGFANYTGVFEVGASFGGGNPANGWIDNYEFLNGIGYTASTLRKIYAWETGRLM